MKRTSIFRQLLMPMIAIVCALAVCLTGIVVSIFVRAYEQEIYGRSQDKSQLVSGEIATFWMARTRSRRSCLSIPVF